MKNRIKDRYYLFATITLLLSLGSVSASELWVKEFPVYPKATEFCSDCLLAGPGKGIVFTKYLSSELPDTIRKYYQSKYHAPDSSGDFRDASGSKILSVEAVDSSNQPRCKSATRPPSGAKSVIVVSVKMNGQSSTSAGSKSP